MLQSLGFDFHRMIAPDQMHEDKLGVWKALFKYLIRLVYALDQSNIAVINER